jgi:HD-GYP domain-containing protein (c-di-GMP phosphodiesterase class II)
LMKHGLQIAMEPGNRQENTFAEIENLLNIGIALSAEKDLNRLLEMIVTEARRITNADAGTLYLKQQDVLYFRISQNQTLKIRQGGDGELLNLPPVPIKKENVSGYVALTGCSVNISDVYQTEAFDFTGPRHYDQMTGYRTRSMLVVPIKNQEGDILGVLQLINAQDPANQEVISFAPYYQKVIESLASQAGVAITNTQLLRDIEELFNSFVKVMAAAIDSRTPYNANHSRRVALLARAIGERINQEEEEPWRERVFTQERLDQLTMAGWLHDIGKIATPLSVMNKATRLGDGLELLLQRFDYIWRTEETISLQRQLELWPTGQEKPAREEVFQLQERRRQLEAHREIILRVNDPGTLVDEVIANQLREIASKTYLDPAGQPKPYLTAVELNNLIVRTGTLTSEERQIMEEHVEITARLLENIPFIKKFQEVPVFARMHHEHLDGKGYPQGIKGDKIPLEARILALVDVFDALTASDRPYKKALPVDQALRIMGFMVKDGKLDERVYNLFVKYQIWESDTINNLNNLNNR